MLDPTHRGTLLEALRPPPGYVVDTALATTYTLDLLALLTAPLAFSLYDRLAAREQSGSGAPPDSVALLHALRQHAERLIVFCEAGRVHRPKSYRPLMTYLEGSIAQARAPGGGAFHPKLWVQRFVPAQRGGETEDVSADVLYRVLVCSRNLTFDQSWDTMLSLEGEYKGRTNAIGKSKPLGAFVGALPDMLVSPSSLDAAQRARVEQMAHELARVAFDEELPDEFDDVTFWPIGHDGNASWPFEAVNSRRVLVVSPFLAKSTLDDLAAAKHGAVLVSRIDELAQIDPATLDEFEEVHVLSDLADDPTEQPEEHDGDNASEPAMRLPPARGLHAKLYVVDDGWNAHVFTGSANATYAAFNENVELLVQLTGTKSKVGVDVTLDGSRDSGGLRQLLMAYPGHEAPTGPSEAEEKLDKLLDATRRVLAGAEWEVRVSRAPSSEAELYDLTVATPRPLSLPEGVRVRVWPITLAESIGREIDGASATTFKETSFQAITPLLAFQVVAHVGVRVARDEFVVRGRLIGAPEDRGARVLHGLLDDPSKVLRFLELLLAPGDATPWGLLEALDGDDEDGRRGSNRETNGFSTLLEPLVRTLDREPTRLSQVHRLVEELRSTEAGRKLLPPDLEQVWEPIWEACQARGVKA